MLFSVIIPTYNRRELLRQALASVWAQTFTDYELIVVDDGSTDGTWEELQALGSQVRALHQQNAGPGAARNLGAQNASGDYLAFLDSDDKWFPWTLYIYAELIRQYAFPSIVAASLIEFKGESDLAGIYQKALRAVSFTDYYTSSHPGYFVGAGMSVLRRNELLKIGGYLERRINCEDHDLILRMGVAPGFVQILSPITLGWRRHSGSSTSDLSKSFAGGRYLIQQELNSQYPGGVNRRIERWRILTRHIRPVSLDCLRQGIRREAWELYRATFTWHTRLGRWKYLTGFLIKVLLTRE